MGKSFSLYPVWTSVLPVYIHCLLPLHPAGARWKECLHLLNSLLQALGQLLGPPKASSAPGWTCPAPPDPPPRTSAPATAILMAYPGIPPVVCCLSCSEGSKTGHSIYMSSYKCWMEGGNHFLGSPGSAPFPAAHGAFDCTVARTKWGLVVTRGLLLQSCSPACRTAAAAFVTKNISVEN